MSILLVQDFFKNRHKKSPRTKPGVVLSLPLTPGLARTGARLKNEVVLFYGHYTKKQASRKANGRLLSK